MGCHWLNFINAKGKKILVMKIMNTKVIAPYTGRNFVTLKIITDEGVYAIGDGTLRSW